VWAAAPLWGVVIALVAWGLWQAMQFRREVMAEVGTTTVAKPVAATEPTIVAPPPPPTGMVFATAEGDELADVTARVTSEEWAKATTPAVLVQDDLREVSGAMVEQTPAAVVTAASVEELMTRGAGLVESGKIVEGRGALNSALGMLGNDPRANGLRQQLASLNVGVFMGTGVVADDPAARFVEIQPGDSFLKLGRRYAVPSSLIEAMNPGLNSRKLKPLAGVKVVQGPFHLRVFKSAGRVDLYARDLYVRSFAGQVEEGNYLPAGNYRVREASKIRVGQRVWVGIEGGGESAREAVSGWLYGQAGPRRGAKRSDLSSGVKLADADLWQLYNVLVEGRSLVRVEP
jgi:hypothetical protein